MAASCWLNVPGTKMWIHKINRIDSLALLKNNFCYVRTMIIQTAQERRFEKVSETVFYFYQLNSWILRQYLPKLAVSAPIFIIFLSSQYLFLCGLRTSITKKYFVLFTPNSVGCVCVCVVSAPLVSLGSMSADALASLSVMNGRQWTGN